MGDGVEAATVSIEVQEKKVLAEVDKALAESEAARELAARNAAEARKLLAEAEKAEIDLAREKRKERDELAGDKHHKSYTLNDSINSTSVKACIAQLANWMRTDPGCDIEIIFNSPGGSIIEGFALWDYIQLVKSKGHRVTTIAMGYAASMAGILLQAGNVRVIGKESWLMIHEASFGAGGKIGEVEDTVEWVKMIQDRILDIFASKSNMTKKQIAAKWRRTDWWISSDKALELGFVDEIR